MAVRDVVQAAAGVGGGGEYVEDVFSTYLYKGNDSVKNIVNGIDLAGEGGLVWIKNRLSTTNHALYDTERGVQKYIRSNTTEAQGTNTAGTHGLTSFNSDGFTLGDNQFGENSSSYPLASWTFRKSPNFFDVVTWTGNNVNGRQIPHNLGSVPGCIIVKCTSIGGFNWEVWHRSTNAGTGNALLELNNSQPEVLVGQYFWGDGNSYIAPTSTHFTVSADGNVNGNNHTFVAYVFAHDAGGFGEEEDQNIISCGSYTTNGSYIGPNVNLGYEPAWILVKNASGGGAWYIIDNMRGWTADGNVTLLNPNTSSAESTTTQFKLNATGFQDNGAFAGNATMIYIAIRRPMKTLESGTEVFSAVLADGISEPLYNTTFPVDMALARNYDQSSNWTNSARLIQGKELNTDSAGAEFTSAPMRFDYQDGWSTQGFSSIYISYNFKRSTGFFDVVAYTGTGVAHSEAHNLGVVPEMIIIKNRNNSQVWGVYNSNSGNSGRLILNATDSLYSPVQDWNSTSPTDSVFSLGGEYRVNGPSYTYVAYLFATLAGVSKVGSYTGTGADLNVDCGFSAGARFILIKRTDSTGDWYVWDTTRGIVAGNDPYLLLNRSDQQVTGTDYIDPLSSGFTVTSSAPAALNASGGSYIFLAIA